MTRTVGHLALAVALGACAAATGSRWWGGARFGARALALAFAGTVTALGALAFALATGDFSLAYVADATSREMSWPYRLGAMWGGMEGSLLLWVAVLCACGAFVGRARLVPEALRPGALAVCGAMGAAFVGILVAAADPFRSLAVPAIDGGGLTPILEHPAMLYHPPLLYAGQVALVVPFALTVAALAARPALLDRAWLDATRRTMLVAWCVLSVGLLAGAHWAYRELGWGGFWAWDPVENGGLMPWLAATAFLHSAAVVARKGRVRAWTAALAVAAFGLVLLGGFLARSGTTESVHAFAEQRAVGRGFLGVFAACLAGAAVLLARRWRSSGGGWAPAPVGSREAALLANNTLLVAVLLVLLAGTATPVVAGWFGDGRTAVGSGYFTTFTAPLVFVLLALAGVGPSLPWSGRRRGGAGAVPTDDPRRPSGLAVPPESGPDRRRGRSGEPSAGRRRWLAAAAGAAAAAGSLALGFRGPFAVATMSAAGASLAVLSSGARGACAGRARGALVAHTGLVLFLAGVVGSTQGADATAPLWPGGTVPVGRYCLAHEGVESRQAGRRTEVRVLIAVLDEACSNRLATLRPGLDAYDGAPSPLPETALRSTPREDLLVTVTDISRPAGDRVVINAFTRPLLAWVWVGGLLMVAGGAWVLAPGRGRRGRRDRRPPLGHADPGLPDPVDRHLL